MNPSCPVPGSLCRLATLLALACGLASCGGGGGGGGGSSAGSGAGTGTSLVASSSVAEVCNTPRPAGTLNPFTGRPYGDTKGTLADEKTFIRSYIDETYLWYQDVRALPAATLDPNTYATPQAYFAALKSPLVTASGKPKDQFHFTYDTPTWVALSLSGVSYGYGFEVTLLSATPPRSAVVAFTEPGTPATANGIARGAAILTVDGVDLAAGDPAALNAGLFPTTTGTHTFVIRDLGSATTRTVTLTAQSITETPVQYTRTLPAPNDKVGYLLFNDHIATAEAQLVTAIGQLKAAAVTDLVLDLRYNGGGYLDIAAELAYMIAGPAQTSGKFFERITYNDKNPFGQTVAQATTNFPAIGQGFTVPASTSLPTLNLNRVYVLTTPGTCSASEAIINGLRGAGITVNTIGGTTCGKPYGFYPQDNCNTTYFAIQFKGVNNLGFGDYADGFAPTCAVADDFSKQLGDPTENQLEVALGLRNTGVCTTPVGAGPTLGALAVRTPGSEAAALTEGALMRSPLRDNRIYRR